MELEILLRPLVGQSRCGQDMMFSPEFDSVQEARRFDDPSLNQGEWVTARKEADWPAVVSSCTQLLAARTKDLRVAVWLVEGLAKTRGVAGLADGYSLLAQLCEQYWPDIHPLPDEGDQALRVGSLTWLLGQSVRMVAALPLTASAPEVYTGIDLERVRAVSREVERNPAQAEAILRDAPLTPAAFDAARSETPAAFYRSSSEHAGRALDALDALQRVIDGHLGAEGPSFESAREALQTLIATLRRFALEAGDGDAPETGLAEGAGDGAADGCRPVNTPTPATPVAGGPAIRSRTQALAQLREVASFFRHTEPHSPVAYLADKAAHWGEMSLLEWLRAVVSDDGTLSRVEEMLGVKDGGVRTDGRG
ncbi:type VI secretion protein ImpA [Parazoarcus communis]|uniref:Type VI secretion protein ImpA n=1 Tax=Parazoarcus communis TaxID=41977 RepID=A0A2U8H496_9RHOO|nr:type VI secretion system protein TssA [Parazoarcus communis]AWI80453.1 type VI secretion protein ImpA [Parazoarcus communis]